MEDLRIVMVSSSDGYAARGLDDDMNWTGAFDKALFKLLTLQGDGVCLTSRRTRKNMPELLPGRKLLEVSRYGLGLRAAASLYPAACLVGGPTLALEAIKLNIVSSLTIVVVRKILGSGLSIAPVQQAMGELAEHGTTRHDVKFGPGLPQVIVWKRS